MNINSDTQDTINTAAPVNGAKKFAVFISANPLNSKAELLGGIEKYLENGLGNQFRIIGEVILSNCVDCSFLANNNRFFSKNRYIAAVLLLEAISQAQVESAFAQFNNMYLASVMEVSDFKFNPDSGKVNYCLWAWDGLEENTPVIRNPELLSAKVSVRAKIELPSGGPCSCVWFVHAPSSGVAHKYGVLQRKNALVLSKTANAAAGYLAKGNQQSNFLSNESVAVTKNKLPGMVMDDSGSDTEGIILNQGTQEVYWESNSLTTDFYSLFPLLGLSPSESYYAYGEIYFWQSTEGSRTVSQYLTPPEDPTGYWQECYFPTTYPIPSASHPVMIGEEYGINLVTNPVFNKIDSFSTWLNTISNTTTYNLPWPEDSYEGGDQDAYNYILSQIAGGGIPKDGNIAPSIISNIYYPSDATYSPDTFNSVKEHLADECTYFTYVDYWFGTNGVLSVINLQISQLASNNITKAANLMDVSGSDTMSTCLNAIIGDISSFVSAIPDVGAAISAAINISYSTALLIEGSQLGTATIQGEIANMETLLNSSLESLADGLATIQNTIRSDWGKLSNLAAQQQSGFISNEIFQYSSDPGSNGSTLPSSYLNAAANGWMVTTFKSLFAAKYTATCTLHEEDWGSVPSNPWSPSDKEYDFTYWLPGSYLDSNNDTKSCYVAFECSTGAPDVVMDTLFGASGGINLDPYQFFMGFNGWPTVQISAALNDIFNAVGGSVISIQD